ncbi:MAG: hypothetical protein LRY53_00815 [Burkholderiaceae bacterium]|nr:hypothetical protein [Burkholderiaceae bacterium]MCD8517770.1 hypothetical protein [Burkholderiaceae bacterium]MCD8537450.1 hypothetical protein [Burkholderiaceae bacterium]MCD8564220.1 hypothetical protein [Burkholderiaceae bacterium]
MSVFRISYPFLDQFDPFWVCRALALKAGTATILLFLCNAFLKSPQVPVVYMLTTLIATIATELIPADTRWRKFGIFWTIMVLLSTAGTMFGLLSYFKLALFLFVVVFSYGLLHFMVKSAASASLPILMIVWGVLQLAGGAATDLTSVANHLLYFYEFGLMGLITVLLFPDFSPNIAKSAFIRILESNARNIGNPTYKNSDPGVLGALYMIRSKVPVLPKSYTTLYESIVQFQAEFMRPHGLTAQEQNQARALIAELAQAVSTNTRFVDRGTQLRQAMTNNPVAFGGLKGLIDKYDQCLA